MSSDPEQGQLFPGLNGLKKYVEKPLKNRDTLPVLPAERKKSNLDSFVSSLYERSHSPVKSEVDIKIENITQIELGRHKGDISVYRFRVAAYTVDGKIVAWANDQLPLDTIDKGYVQQVVLNDIERRFDNINQDLETKNRNSIKTPCSREGDGIHIGSAWDTLKALHR